MKVPVYVNGIRWTTFGYSHDTRKPNPHIARDLGITQNEAQALARCHRTKEWYFEIVRGRLREQDQQQ